MILVYGVCMVLVGITASAQAGVISVSYQQSALESIVSDDAALVRAVVNSEVRLSDLPPSDLTPIRRAELSAVLGALVDRTGMVRVELRAADGTLIASDDGRSGAAVAPVPADGALDGRSSAMLVGAGDAGRAHGPSASGTLIRETLPLVAGDRGVQAVMTVWRNADPILATVDRLRGEVVALTVSAAVVLAVVLTLVFRRAQGRIARQTTELVDASRRDAVTGLLNHGAVVDALAAAIEEGHRTGGSVAVALVDIDNFRLVNDTLGHEAGDEALTMVASRVGEAAPWASGLGRYGPDELLLFVAGRTADLLPGLQAAREALAGAALRHGDGEAIPVTISAGLAECPGDATGVTELLALAAHTLAAAKASGGDAVRTTRVEVDAADSRAFDVFQGLIIAIDTKDRYTKRHSEDVARYGLFIADRLGLDAELQRAIRLAGLLHDVGKIGIPDAILRKPGHLTEAELAIVRQHVALGDMIVRDLPDIDLVRAGIRTHHERWDGKGYLEGLAGDDIPLIGRILAVGDAFSAMTTTRPYRKALSLRDAMSRLLDAAGTQLDGDIAVAFIRGLEHDPAAPLPGSPVAARWSPRAAEASGAAA